MQYARYQVVWKCIICTYIDQILSDIASQKHFSARERKLFLPHSMIVIADLKASMALHCAILIKM